jgi:periplasmic divalent cation tolerance protein
LEAIIILTTTPTLKDARKISDELINKKLAACASVVSHVESVFRWQGKVTKEKECLIIIKTRGELFNDAAKQIRRLHPYKTPEIIASPITAGNRPYLKWLEESTNPPKKT